MRTLVPLAHRLILLTGDPEAGVELANRIFKEGLEALGDFDDDLTTFLKEEMRAKGIVDRDGNAVAGTAAAFVMVSDMLAALPEPPSTAPPGGRLVFTTPKDIVTTPAEQRLDLLVADIIRMSTGELHIGSAFWNDEGLDSMIEVLRPAVQARGVQTTLYAQVDGERHVKRLRAEAGDLLSSPTFQAFTYQGPANSLMHAKFVVADRTRGYLGTANLTSLGFGHHIECGVELTPAQSSELVDFLDSLHDHNLFRPTDWQEGAPQSLL